MAPRPRPAMQQEMTMPQIDQGLLAEGLRIAPLRQYEDDSSSVLQQSPAPIEKVQGVPGINENPTGLAIPPAATPPFSPPGLLDIPMFNGARLGMGDLLKYLPFGF
jgi:hypothetical protein